MAITILLLGFGVILLGRTDRTMEGFRRCRDFILFVAISTMSGKSASFRDFFLINTGICFNYLSVLTVTYT